MSKGLCRRIHVWLVCVRTLRLLVRPSLLLLLLVRLGHRQSHFGGLRSLRFAVRKEPLVITG